MNENEKGKPYSFPDSFILVAGYNRVYFNLSYRQTKGIIKATVGKKLPTDNTQVIHRYVEEQTN